jgi:hypothetical protein
MYSTCLYNSRYSHCWTKSCENRINNTQHKLQECVTVEGVREHQAALQAVADANSGIRAAGTPIYDSSVDYLADTQQTAGYMVELDPFEFTYLPPSTLEQTAPIFADYETGAFTGSGFGEIAGSVIPVDLVLSNSDWPADPTTSTSGCEATDFNELDFSGPNDVAIVQRGACFFF